MYITHARIYIQRKNGCIKEIVKYALSDHISYGNSQTIHESKMKKLWDTVNKYLGKIYVPSSSLLNTFISMFLNRTMFTCTV